MPFPSLQVICQWAGIAMPTLYAGITFQYSLTMTLLARTASSSSAKTIDSDTRLLARQWLALYQQGPRWVPPLVHAGVVSNLYLAFSSSCPPPSSSCTALYLHLAAAALTLSIFPVTFLYLEPGVNGACKWKVERLLRGSVSGTGEVAGETHGLGLELASPADDGGNGGGAGGGGGGGGGSVVGVGDDEAAKSRRRRWVQASVVRHSASEESKRWAERAEMRELVEAWARLNHPRWVIGLLAGMLSFAATKCGGNHQ